MKIKPFIQGKSALLGMILMCYMGTLFGQEDHGQNEKMGYCFDVAYHQAQKRLYVAAGAEGLHVFLVKEGRLKFVTTFYDDGYYRNIDISQDRAFIADAKRGLVVMDISGESPGAIWQWKESETNTPGMGIHVDGSRAYLAVGNANGYEKAGIYIFNIFDQDSPELIGYAGTKNAWDVWTKKSYAFVADMSEGLTVLDFSNPSSPRKIANTKWDNVNSMAEIVRGEGDKVYIASGKHGLIIVDIQDPHNPQVEGKFKSGPRGFAEGLCVQDKIVYLANGHDFLSRENGLFIIDCSESQKPLLLGKCTVQGWVEGVCLGDQFLFIANTYSGVRCIDISNPYKPEIRDSYGLVETKPSIAEKICYAIEKDGIEAALILYQNLREKALHDYEFGEDELNRLGYYLLELQKIDQAIAVFQLNQDVFPRSYNTLDSLGDAYLYKAVWLYQKSLEINPENKHAQTMIKRIMGK